MLKVTLVQTTLIWENIGENLLHFSNLLKTIRKNETDLILLPEMFSTGFTMNAGILAEDINGITFSWMRKMSKSKNAVICGSIVFKEKKKFYNRLFWVSPDGSFDVYDKRHLFRMAHEQNFYTAGTKRLITELKGWKICPLVCYDLRFPIWSRNTNDFDLLLYVANWPSKRKFAWQQLLIARAIENQCFVAGLNRIGRDGNKFIYSGQSVMLNPFGKSVFKLNSKEAVKTISINKEELINYRKLFPVAMDADNFKIIL